MLKKEIIRTGIIVLIAEIAAIGMATLQKGDIYYYLATAAFYPIWFIGIWYCGTPWSRIGNIYLGLMAAAKWKEIRGDRYHVSTTLVGGLILAYILVLGWMWGLVKYVRRIVRAIRE